MNILKILEDAMDVRAQISVLEGEKVLVLFDVDVIKLGLDREYALQLFCRAELQLNTKVYIESKKIELELLQKLEVTKEELTRLNKEIAKCNKKMNRLRKAAESTGFQSEYNSQIVFGN